MNSTEVPGLFSPLFRLGKRASEPRRIRWSTKLAVIAGLALASGNLRAVIIYTWTGNGTVGDFTNSGNWLGGTFAPNSITQDVIFDANPVTAQAVPLASRTFRDIYFNNTHGAVPNYTFNDSGTFTLTGMIITDYGGNLTFGPNLGITLAKDNANNIHTIRTVSSTITIASNISEDASIERGNLLKTGNGTLTLSGNNTFTAGVSLSAGTLNINSATALGVTTNNTTGVLSISNGTTIDNTSGAPITIANNNPQTWSGNFTFGGTNALNLGTGNVSLSGNRTITVNASTLTVGGVIDEPSSVRSLTKAGAGTLVLTGTNLYGGTTTVSAGTLQIGNGGSTGSVFGNIAVSSGANLAINRTGNLSFTSANALSGSGEVTNVGTGNLTLSGNNSSFSGNLTATAGNILLSNTDARGTGTWSFSGTSKLDVAITGNASQSIIRTGKTEFTGNATLGANNSYAIGGGTQEFSGSASLVASASNAITGGTQNFDVLSSLSASAANAVTGGTQTFRSSSSLFANVTNSITGGNQTLRDSAVAYANAAGAINGGTIRLYDSSLLQMGAANALGSSTNIIFTIQNDAGPGEQGGGGYSSLGGESSGGTLSLNGNNTTVGSISSDGGTTGIIQNGAAAAATLTVTLSGSDSTFSGTLQNGGTGALSLTKDGTSTLVLTGNSTFTGNTTINAGTLQIGSGNTTGSLALAGSTLDYNNQGGSIRFVSTYNATGTATLGGLSGSQPLLLANSNDGDHALALTVGANNQSTTYSGNLTEPSGKNSSLIKTGTGTLTLAGTNNFSGGTTVSAGTLQIGDGVASGTLAGNIVNDAALTFSRSSANSLSFGGNISGTGNLTFRDGGNFTLSGNNTYTGATTIINGSTLIASAAGALPSATNVAVTSGTLSIAASQTIAGISGSTPGNVNLASGQSLTINTTATNSSFNGNLTNSGSLIKIGTGNLTLGGGFNTYSGGTSVNAGNLILTNSSGSGTGTGDVTVASGATLTLGAGNATGSLTANVANAGNVTFFRSDASTYGGIISGNGAVSQTGNNTLTLTGNHTYTGGTTISAGTLKLGDGGTSGSIAGNIANNATLTFARSDLLSIGGVITGNGQIIQTGTGTVTLTANNTSFSGLTTVSSGVLQLGTGGTSGGVGGNITINSPGMLTFFRSDDIEYPLVLSGNGTFTKAGTGTLLVSGGSSTFSGTFAVNTGTLALSGANSGANPSATVASGALLDLRNNATLTSLFGLGTTQIAAGKTLTIVNAAPSFSANVTGAGGVTFNNSSTITVNETYTGPTTITAGTLSLGNGGTTGSVAGNLTIALATPNTGGVQFNRSDDVSYAGVISGNGGLTKSGAGTLTLSGNNTYTGTTTVSSGTLAISAEDNLGAAPGTFAAGSLTLNGTTLQTTANLTLSANRGITLSGGGGTFDTADSKSTLTIGGNITGGSNLTKSGSGTLVLAGASNYGTTIVNAGELQLASTGSLNTGGNVTVNGTGIFKTFATNQTIRGLISTSPTSSVIIETGATLNPNLPTGETSTFAGLISGAGNLLKNGPGTFILTGTAGHSGQTTVSSGTLQIGNGGSLGFISGNISTGNTTVGNGTLAFDRNDPVTYSSVLSGNGTVLKGGAATLTLSGNANTFNGSFTIAAGTLIFTGANTGANLTANVTSGAVLDLQNNLTLASLTGAGSTQIAANKTLTIGNFTSNFTSTITGAGGVTFNQPTTITVNETYTGPTTIKSGQLSLGAINGTTGSVAGNIVIAGATDNAASVIFNRTDNHSYGGVISGNGFLLKNGAGTMTLTNQSTYTGNTTVSAGTLILGVANALPTTTRLQLGNNTVLNVAQDQSVAGFFGGTPSSTISIDAAKTLKVSLGAATAGTFYSGIISGAGGLRIGPSTASGGGHTVGLYSDNTYTGGTVVEAGGKLLLGNNGSTGSVLGNITNDGTVIFNRGTSSTFSGVISGGGSVSQGVISGSATTGDVKLTGENTYTGGTNIYSKALIIGDGGTTGSIVGNVTLFNNSTLGFNRSDATTFAGVVSGTGGIGKGSTGTLTLTGQSTYTGNTEIKSGTLTIGVANALPTTTQLSLAASAVLDVLHNQTIAGFLLPGDVTSAIHLASGATFTVAMPVADTTTTFAGTVDGTGTFAVSGTGNDVVNLTGTVASTVGTSIGTGATLNIASGGSLAGPIALGNGSILTLGNSGTQTFTNVISGAGSLLSSGGTTNLTAPNTYTGGTIIGGGKIIVSNTSGSATGSGPVVVNSGGTLGGTGIITGTLVLNTGSTVAPGNSPGTLTVGPTTLLGGALFTFDINSTFGTAGTNWDILAVTGGLTITATPANPFIINLVSLTGSNGTGLLSNFNPTQAYSWQFVSTTGGITGFSAGAFQYNASQFQNSLAGGFFVVSQTGNDLFLNFSPVPEPSTWALLATGLGALVVTALRRRKKL